MSRNRKVLALAATLAGAMVLAACGGGGGGDTGGAAPTQQRAEPTQAPFTPPADAELPAGDGQGQCSGDPTIAYVGTIAGANAGLGIAIKQAVQLAIEEHNQANAGCQVSYKEFDTAGSPQTALAPTVAAINDPTILGIVGLPFSGESEAVGPALSEAGLVSVTPSATRPDLTTKGFTHFFRGLGNDAVQGPSAARFITGTLGAQSVCVIRDDSAYGQGLATELTNALGAAATCQEEVKTGQREFSAAIGTIQSGNPDAIFYAGYYDEGAPLAQQLRDAGIEADIVVPDGVKDPIFVQNAGEASDGVYMTCPCLPGDVFPEFTGAYKARWNVDPQTYSAEAYDATTILLRGLDQGIADRPALLEHVRNYQGQGLTKRFQWNANGELNETPVWSYVVKDGQIQRLSPIE
ncbi:branched-chain amino acid ABC transporter substrate-binding protein [Pseudonocardia sp. DSM 110487]|uniref:branched-chain amino acid ABC transporter substrate-binding protein n=1 Tax=Pseudonocardia sp. DSM 110487 TaxID=2865833 RepID=UPI001C6A58FD|nr:branched-chain amino acid ABC transporter substrate-binding protein [Pseudonocardia sp. DSM 110487]QYN38567.1 branched-chain amino acid ABC transporter substrate-binding protein [Pseudonocardia sp. DSM 110487]